MELEKEVNIGWKNIWKIWFDMECDWTRDYIKKMYQKSKIDQVLDFYWIPHIYKDEYKRYLRYRIQPRHYDIVNNHFIKVLELEWYDISDFNYWELQEDYNRKVPEAEQTWLDLHIDYDDFIKRDQKHRESIKIESEVQVNEQMLWMQQMMLSMMDEMKQLKSMIWNPNVLLSKENNNAWKTEHSWSDSTRNAEWDWESTTNNTAWTTISETVTTNETKEIRWAAWERNWWNNDTNEQGIWEIEWIDKWDQWTELREDLWSRWITWTNWPDWPTADIWVEITGEWISETTNTEQKQKKDRRTM